MLAELCWRLGVGAVLGWAALPLFIRLARRSRQASPAAYYRALVTALAIAVALVVAPALRGALGTAFELPLSLAPGAWDEAPSITLVAEWVSPILGSREEAWPSMPLARGLTLLGGLWTTLLVIGTARSLVGRWQLARAHARTRSASARVLGHAGVVAAELGIRPPAIRVADGVVSAFTFGFFSPVVVLGHDTESASDDDLDFVLRHELTHVQRGDVRHALWIELALRCFTGHPQLAALRAEIRFAREAAVDEAAAGPQPLEYARFLLGLAEQVQSLRAPQPSMVSMADTALERRIEMLMSKKERKRSRWGAAWLGLSGLVLGALVFVAPSSFADGSGGAATARVTGNLSVEQVQKVVFGKPRPLIDCYNQLPAPRENLGVRFVFQIAADGTVMSGARAHSDKHPELDACLATAIQKFVFPRPSSGTVQVELPAELSPEYDERRQVAEAQQGVSQRLAPEVIQKVVRDHYVPIRACYEKLGKPLPKTKVDLKFTIARDGKVSDGYVESKQYPELGKCIDPVMRSMVFPAPKDGIVTVGYPIEFGPGDP